MSEDTDHQVISDCRTMLHYAIGEGMPLSQDLLAKIHAVDVRLKAASLPLLSPVAKELVGDGKAPAPAAGGAIPPVVPPGVAAPGVAVPGAPIPIVGGAVVPPPVDLASIPTCTLILEIHGALSNLIKPATSVSLRATARDGGTGPITWPHVVRAAMAIALFALLAFVITGSVCCAPKGEDVAALKDASKTVQLVAAAVYGPAETAHKARSDADKPKDTLFAAAQSAKKASDEAVRLAHAVTDEGSERLAVEKLTLAIDATEKAAVEAGKVPITLEPAVADARKKLPDYKKLPVMSAAGGCNSRVWDCLNALFGAALGAAFYVLVRCYKFMVERSFDPKYNNAYYTRMVIGTVAGVVLWKIFDPKWGQYAPGTIALIGGFSAEAVEQIFLRLAETMVTMVKGDGSAEANAKSREILLKVREKLIAVPTTDPAVKKAIEEAQMFLR